MSLIHILMFRDLFIEVLTYLDLCDLSYLDVSIHSKYLRLFLLDSFKFLVLSTDSEFNYYKCYKHSTLEWLLKRSFRFSYVGYLPLHDDSLNKIILTSKSCLKAVKLSVNHCITNHSLVNLVQACNNLNRLEIIGNNFISNDFIYAVAKYCMNLTYLDLTGAWQITNEAMKCLLESLVPLQVLILWSNHKLCDKLFTSAVMTTSKLREITINDLPNISDDTLFVIGKICSNLETLCLVSLPLITKEGLNYILKECIELKELNILGCGKGLIILDELYSKNLYNRSEQYDIHVTLRTDLFESPQDSPDTGDIYQQAENYLAEYNSENYLAEYNSEYWDHTIVEDSESSDLYEYYEFQENY